MQNFKIELLNTYNKLLNRAIHTSSDFPTYICDFIIEQFDFDAVAIFKVDNDNDLHLMGKSGDVKHAYEKNIVYKCSSCPSLKNPEDQIIFRTQDNCELQLSEYVQYEGCLFIKLNDADKIHLKVSKKTEFSNSDRDNLILLGESLKNLFLIWTGNNGSTYATVGQLVTEIAHELRTPTNSIMGFASLLNEENLTPTQSEYISTLKENAFNLISIINDIIDLAKLETGHKKDELNEINLNEFIDDILKIFRDKSGEDKIEFLINIDKKIPGNVKVDYQKLRYILVNLFTWSIRLTERGKISLTVNIFENNKINFKITDSSQGISSKNLREIFKPFALNELSGSKMGNSTGLGLILANRYIEHLNGNLEITSAIGKGTTYNFSIYSEFITKIETQITAIPKTGQTTRVLVIEDDYATSKLLSNYLNKWGYDPVIVNSAEQAHKIIEKDTFLAILMDIVLPDSNGFELLKELRDNPKTKRTPIIICSVEAEQQKAFLMGAVEYFVKPINYNYLVEVLTSYKLKKDSNILIVDDDEPTLNLLKESVTNLGFNPVAESHSERVADMIENINLDLAIIDLDMPEVNGFDLIKLIKSKPQFSKLPIIIYTGKENYTEELRNIDGMFVELLQKSSTNIEELADVISQMINKYEEPSKPEEILTKTDTVKILLVEDYKHSQIIVTRLLKKNDFDSIVVVENGQEAVDEAKKQKYDLILMDMQMPVMNGFEATERIRQMPQYNDTPIIALTAFAMKGDREKCLEAGATDYIPKPIDSQEFIEKVKYYTENKMKVAH